MKMHSTLRGLSILTFMSCTILAGKCLGTQPWGTALGSFNGVANYSNGSGTYDSGIHNYIGSVDVGLEWQCVEYVQRYYYTQYGLNLRGLSGGLNAWQFFGSASIMQLAAYANGSTTAPQVGDILCFNETGSGLGHVAIIRAVDQANLLVHVIQQNVKNGDSSPNGYGTDVDWTFKYSVSGGTYTVDVTLANVGGSRLGPDFYCQGWLRKPSGGRLSAPTLIAPVNGASGVSTTPSFSWSQVSGNQGYRIIVSTSASDLPTDPKQAGGTPSNGFNQTVVQNTTSYTLSGTLTAGTTYYWAVHALGTTLDQAGYWSSGNSFTTAQPPTVTVTSPNGGENWQVGSSHNITATSSGSITSVEIDYSINGGSTWIYFTGYSPLNNTINVPWTIPNAPSTTCRVRVIIGYNGGTVSDVSDGNFAISSPTDTTPPTVSISTPTSGQTFTATPITISGTASDSGSPSTGVSLVQVQVNGTGGTWQTASGTTSWSASVSLSSGVNTIYVRGRDGVGNYSTIASVSVTYNPPDTQGPAITIVSPANNATVTSASLPVSGTASDSGRGNNGVSSVTVNGVSANGGTASGAGTANWNATITLSPGVNTITVAAKDTFNNSSQQQISVTYSPPDITPPTVTISSPASGTTYTSAQTVTINAAASDDVGVTRVDFYDGTTLKSSDTSSPYGYSWAISSDDNGSHNWTVRAYDAAGNSKTSSVVTLTVNISTADTTPPAVAINSPTSGQSFTTSTITVSGTASDQGSPSTGVALVELQVNSAGWQTASGTTSWSSLVSLASGSNLIQARSKDGAGNYSFIAAISVIYTPPSGSLQVTISPSDAVLAGAQWQVDGGTWQDSGATVPGLAVGSHPVAFKTVSGWNTPASQVVSISNGSTTTTTGTYTLLTTSGSLQVIINPASAVNAGAQWQVDSGAWQDSGIAVSDLSAGDYSVAFKPIGGYTTPGNLMVSITNGSTTTASGTYIPTSTPTITSPTPGSTLTSSSATFQWSNGGGVSDYFLYVGRAFGTNDIYGQDQGLNLSATVDGLPQDGNVLYVRLWWQISGLWYFDDYTYATLPASQTGSVLITQLQAKLNFAKANADSCSLKGMLDLGASFNPSGETMTLDLGDAQVSFTLNRKGRGVAYQGTCRLTYKKKTGTWTLTAKLRRGDWQTLWAEYGLVDTDVSPLGVPVEFPVVVVVGDDTFTGEKSLLYKVKPGKSGIARLIPSR
ncbi:MAG TPA: Ig-like domain-containing protein [Verrucomicrobiae bacterium]|nr:Ig-like domain-containing protein [Verrucomicrobiae bacterium]